MNFSRRAKIIATIGPATNDTVSIKKLLKAGMNAARLNFSHGDQKTHQQVIHRLRKSSEELNLPITIIQDLSGPKIRTGEFEKGSINLQEGQKISITTREITGNDSIIPVSYPHLPEAVTVGGKILMDDGQLEFEVLDIHDDTLETMVQVGGVLKPHKGVNLPGADLELRALTPKDIADLEFGLKQDIDVIALSFVRSSDDIGRLRQEIAKINPSRGRIPVIAKLEHPDAIKNLHSIIHASDGVMVARGDLGIEMPPELVPIEQKKIVSMANKHLNYVIIATQMLDSMMHNPRPTRAEASDVANAILDGTDAVMLSGETAVGKYPFKSVEMMNAIICQGETHMKEWGQTDFKRVEDFIQDDAVSITSAARELAHDQNVSAIAVFTQSGRTARLMSKARPRVPILAFTPSRATYQYMSMLWGTKPYLIPKVDTLEEMLTHVEAAVVSGTPLQAGQEIVLIAGFPINQMLPPNFALMHTIGKR